MIEEIFCVVLKEIRLEKGLSQEKLAEYSDLDRTYISLLERGLRQPSLITVFKLSKGLNILPQDLVARIHLLEEQVSK